VVRVVHRLAGLYLAMQMESILLERERLMVLEIMELEAETKQNQLIILETIQAVLQLFVLLVLVALEAAILEHMHII
jgi:hypothetical protein